MNTLIKMENFILANNVKFRPLLSYNNVLIDYDVMEILCWTNRGVILGEISR